MKPDLIMITTCCDHKYIYKLITSVLNFNKTISIHLVVVNQFREEIKVIQDTNHTKLLVIEHNRLENTSVARNIGVDYILANSYTSSFICFPDDDSSFDNRFFELIADMVENKNYKNLVTDVYCTGTNDLFRKVNLPNGTGLTKYNYNIVGAVNIILNFETFTRVGHFDERFGVNAKYGAGEDGDYFIRAVEYEPFYYNNELYSYHPSGDSKYKELTYSELRKRLQGYAVGVIALLCKHKLYIQAIWLTIRAIGGVLIYLFKFKFKVALAYFEAFFTRLFFLMKFRINGVK